MDRSRSTASELMPPDTNVTPDGAVATSSLLAEAPDATSDSAKSDAAASAPMRFAGPVPELWPLRVIHHLVRSSSVAFGNARDHHHAVAHIHHSRRRFV